MYQSVYIDLRKSKMICLFCAGVVILASSVTAAPFFAIFCFYFIKAYAIKIFNLKSLFLLAISLTIIISTVDFSNLRAFQLAKMVTSDEKSVSDDVSAISRFASIVNYSLPIFSGRGLFGNFLEYVDENYVINLIKDADIDNDFKLILINGAIAEGGGLRTKSAISQSFFLFGVLGIGFWILLIVHMRHNLRKKNGAQALLVIIVLGYLVQIPLGHPTFLLVIGIILFSPIRKLRFSRETKLLGLNQL